jgi:2-dehydro-3-deoxygalactonokinase
LSNKSILANSVRKRPDDSEDLAAFDRGVKNGAAGNILHEVFSVRTNQVLRNLRPEENYSYLSGLLIGSELSEIANTTVEKVSLVCGARLKRQYMRALHLLLPADRIEFRDADHALVRGHQLICQHFAAEL